ncbi:hypothetical protein J1605_011960 [Eschrichtius robustus]|uniref:Uncharacterized protein n=1 Tax=Eschrichtius robustus TaxID=9764 RepID=A0AB34GNY9_ESCRO|nr:hypothetical protein J1605_011960 [Eschrichtius robustus]
MSRRPEPGGGDEENERCPPVRGHGAARAWRGAARDAAEAAAKSGRQPQIDSGAHRARPGAGTFRPPRPRGGADIQPRADPTPASEGLPGRLPRGSPTSLRDKVFSGALPRRIAP